MTDDTLGTSSARLSLLEAAPDAMLVTDNEGRIVLVNEQAERLFGYPRPDLLGNSIDMLVPARFRGPHAKHRDTYHHTPRVRPMGAGLELFGLRKDGGEFPVEISLSPITIGGEIYVSSAIRDTTTRKEIERALRDKNMELAEKNLELEKANLTKDRFLAAMSHELRTPLNAIIGFTGVLLMKLPGPLTEEQERQLQIVDSSARHLLSLINDILDVAKISSGKVALNFEAVDVRAVIDEVVASLMTMAEDKRLSLRVEGKPTTVRTDRRALHQILLNLINNALKYTDAGEVRIVLSGDPAHAEAVCVKVIDTGIGIAEEDQARLFRAFEQLDTSSTRRFQGVGLGLHLSERLAGSIGAALQCESILGVGSTFTLTLRDVS